MQGTIAELFEACGINYQEMEPGESVPVEDQNIEVRSFDHTTNTIVWRRVMSLTRKQDAKCYEVYNDLGGMFLFKCTADHKVFDPTRDQYVGILDARRVYWGTETYNHPNPDIDFLIDPIKIVVKPAYFEEPILDLEVEGTGNYFANGVLSHNTPGGNALKFYASQRLDVRRREVIKDGTGDDAAMIGNRTEVKVTKNKVAPPFKSCEFVINYGTGIDKDKDLLDAAVAKGIIEKAGSWYSFSGTKTQGDDKMIALLRDDTNLRKNVIAKL